MPFKMPHRLSSTCAALIVLCLSGSVLLPRAALKEQIEGSRDSSISYAKQIIQDASPLPGNRIRAKFIAPARNAKLDCGLPQPFFLSIFPSPYSLRSRAAAPPRLQPLALFNPTTRSPPR